MPKYKIYLELNFESEENLPVFHVAGTLEETDPFVALLPLDPPADVDEEKVHVVVSVQKCSADIDAGAAVN